MSKSGCSWSRLLCRQSQTFRPIESQTIVLLPKLSKSLTASQRYAYTKKSQASKNPMPTQFGIIVFQSMGLPAMHAASHFARLKPAIAPRAGPRGPNYALKRTVREEVSGAIMRCGPHGRLA
jgi:hypothetical protein